MDQLFLVYFHLTLSISFRCPTTDGTNNGVALAVCGNFSAANPISKIDPSRFLAEKYLLLLLLHGLEAQFEFSGFEEQSAWFPNLSVHESPSIMLGKMVRYSISPTAFYTFSFYYSYTWVAAALL